MNASQTQRIVCPSCGKRYVWKEQLRGKRVACACGQAFEVPSQPRDDEENLYEVIDDRPSAAAPMPPPPRAAKVLTYESRQVVREERRKFLENWRIQDMWLPATMILLGVACRLLTPYMESAIGTSRLVLAMGLVALGTAFNIILMLLTLKVASFMVDVDFGGMSTAATKLAVLFVIAASAGGFCASLGRFDPYAITFGVFGAILLYWILFPLLFKTNVTETMWTVSVLIVVQAIVNIGVWKA